MLSPRMTASKPYQMEVKLTVLEQSIQLTVCHSNDVLPQHELSRGMESLQKRIQGELLGGKMA